MEEERRNERDIASRMDFAGRRSGSGNKDLKKIPTEKFRETASFTYSKLKKLNWSLKSFLEVYLPRIKDFETYHPVAIVLALATLDPTTLKVDKELLVKILDRLRESWVKQFMISSTDIVRYAHFWELFFEDHPNLSLSME